jgi:ribosomal 30S subunit maturation factor RimM
MKLCAIYCCWADGLDLLPYSVDNISPVVDGVIIIHSVRSNTGQYKEFIYDPLDSKVSMYQYEGTETDKRNFGLAKAKQNEFTHFIIMDSDEFYRQEDVIIEKERMEANNINGLVCRVKVLFKKPTLCIEDHTLVPFIHKLYHNIQAGSYKYYPFAYDEQGNAHIDPTRRLNCFDRIEMSEVFMYHASWIRSDVNLKIDNSAARNNLRKSSIYKDLEKAAPGVYNEFYRKELVTCENYFNLPDL